MRKAIVAAGGIVALALLAGASTASAGSLMGSGAPLAAPAQAQAQVEDVRWVRRCWTVRRVGPYGGVRVVTRCRSVWAPGGYYRGYYHDYGHHYGYYRHHGYRHGYDGYYGRRHYYDRGDYDRGDYGRW